MRYVLSLVSIVAACLLVAGCSDHGTGTQIPQIALEGTVRDASGAPIAEANVAIEYHLSYLGPIIPYSATADPALERIISYSVPQEAYVDLWLTDFSGAFVATLVDSELTPPGTYDVVWDGTDTSAAPVTGGVYKVHLKTGDVSIVGFVLFNLSCEQMRTRTSLTRSDANGHFAVDWSIVPLGVPTRFFDEHGEYVADSIVSNEISVCAWQGERSGSTPATLIVKGTISVDVVVQE